MALVNYAPWDAIAQNNFAGGHFVVVTGLDDAHVFVHDPLFRGQRRNLGAYFVWKNDKFLEGWGTGQAINNPNFQAFIPGRPVQRL